MFLRTQRNNNALLLELMSRANSWAAGKDVLKNVERLKFEDRTFVLDGRNNAPVMGQYTNCKPIGET